MGMGEMGKGDVRSGLLRRSLVAVCWGGFFGGDGSAGLLVGDYKMERNSEGGVGGQMVVMGFEGLRCFRRNGRGEVNAVLGMNAS